MANAVIHVRAKRRLGYGVNGVYQRAVCWVSRTLKPARETEKLAVAEVAVHRIPPSIQRVSPPKMIAARTVKIRTSMMQTPRCA
jgi:hypothetical protein